MEGLLEDDLLADETCEECGTHSGLQPWNGGLVCRWCLSRIHEELTDPEMDDFPDDEETT